METTPEPEIRTASTPIVVSQLGKGNTESYFHLPYDDAPGLEALSAAATSNLDYIRPLSIPAHSPRDAIVSPPSSNNLNFILNPTGPDGPSACDTTWPITYADSCHRSCSITTGRPGLDFLTKVIHLNRR
jgi:hypothetical protein